MIWGPGPWAGWGSLWVALEAAMPECALRAQSAASPPSDSTGSPCIRFSHTIPSATQNAAQAPSRSTLPCKRLMAAQGRGSAPAFLPEARQRCRHLHVSRNNHDFGVSSVRVSHTAGSAHDVLETKITVIHCSLLFVVVPSPPRCAAAQAGRCTALVCYLYADLASIRCS